MKFISLILSISLLFSFDLSFNENPIEVIQNSEELINPFSGGLNKPKIQWVDWDSDNDDDLFILDEDGYIRYMENLSIGSDFKFNYKVENLKVIPGDYVVNVSTTALVSSWENSNKKVQYWIALEQPSD